MSIRSVGEGLSAFPLTPLRGDSVDEDAFANIVGRLARSGADSITALGSTGSYAYLSREERARVATLAVQHAAGKPVYVGIGALRTSQVLAHAEDAADAGASALLLAPMTYQSLGNEEVFELFRVVSGHTNLPVIVYDNPGTTHFAFTLDLYSRIAALPGVASIKIPGLAGDQAAVQSRISQIRGRIPKHVSIGISGDAFATEALVAGCDGWYSVIGGTLPQIAVGLTRAALAGRSAEALAESDRLRPLWSLFGEFGSLRVVAAIAELLGLAGSGSLPRPILELDGASKQQVARVLTELGLVEA